MYRMKDERPRGTELLRSIAGLVFFGTPFRGASGSLSNGALLKFVTESGDEVEPRILQVLAPGHEVMSDIREEFRSIPDIVPIPLPPMHCFFETLPTEVWRLVKQPKREAVSTI